jgi:hypothetical protein
MYKTAWIQGLVLTAPAHIGTYALAETVGR